MSATLAANSALRTAATRYQTALSLNGKPTEGNESLSFVDRMVQFNEEQAAHTSRFIVNRPTVNNPDLEYQLLAARNNYVDLEELTVNERSFVVQARATKKRKLEEANLEEAVDGEKNPEQQQDEEEEKEEEMQSPQKKKRNSVRAGTKVSCFCWCSTSYLTP